MDTFKKGDVVMLKSGGPAMTVSNERTEDGLVHCAWFNEKTGSYDQRSFNPALLEKLGGSGAVPGGAVIWGK